MWHKLLLVVCLTAACYCQTGTSYPFVNPPPDRVTGGTARVIGDSGNETYHYWIVAKYPGGDAAPYGPLTVTTARPFAQMGIFRYITLSWTAQPLATGYDVLRTTTSTTPTGACACVISANQATTILDDVGLSASAYTVSPAAGIYGQIYIDSINAATPVLKQNLNGTISDIGSGGGGASSLSGLTDLQASRTSASVLTVAAGNARVGSSTSVFGAATGTLSGTSASGTVYAYVSSAGVLTLGHNAAWTLTCSGCTTATGISAFPAGAIPLATWTVTSTAWDVSGGTDFRAINSVDRPMTSTTLTVATTATGTTVNYSPIVPVELVVFDFATATSTGDGKYYLVIPSTLNGMNLVSVTGSVITVGTTNTTTVQLARCAVVATGSQCSGTVVDMLSTLLTIDSNENKSSTAAAAAVINTANDDVATDQVIRVDVDAISTTPATGLVVILGFQLP